MAKKKIKVRKKGTKRNWVAVGTLAAVSAMGGMRAETSADPTRNYSEQNAPARRLTIAAGPLGDVLSAYERLTGTRVALPSDAAATIWSAGVSGVMTPGQALSALLQNTGLEANWKGDKAELRPARQSATVDVNDVASPLTESMPKFQGPLLDTPQTINVVSQKTMQQQGVTTLRDAVRNVAGISLAAGEGGAQGDNLTVRGFTARNDLFIDGMRDFGSYYRDAFDTEEVQVLQGPSSVTFGRGSTGGVINQATKTPELQSFVRGDLQFGTDTTRRADIDWSAPIPKLGSGTAFRLAAMGNIGGVAGRNQALNRRTGFAPSLAFGLGTPTRVTLSYFHQNDDNIPDYGIPWLFNQPAPVNRNNYYGVDGNFLRTYADIGTARVEHDVNDRVTLRNQFRSANYRRALVISEARIPTGVAIGTPLSAINVTRNEISARSTESMLDNQTDVVAHVETFGLRHTLVSGFEVIHEGSDPTRFSYAAPSTSLLNPSFQGALGPGVVTSKVQDRANSVGAYVLDTIDLGRHWQASGGLRYDRFTNRYEQFTGTPGAFQRTDAKPTWRGALVYKPVARGSIYVDAGTSFNPSAESLSLSSVTANLPPESNRTLEAGTKWDLVPKRLGFDTAVFRTTKFNARETDPNNSLLTTLSGTQQVTGGIVNLRAHLTSRWEAISSYSYLDSKVLDSRFYPRSVGFPLVNVPKHTFNLWTNGRLPWRFEGGAGMNFVGTRNASSTVPLDPVTQQVKAVPGYWVFNAMLSHPINEHVDLQVNGYNLTNRYYYDQLHPGHVVPGAGRSLLVNLKFKF